MNPEALVPSDITVTTTDNGIRFLLGDVWCDISSSIKPIDQKTVDTVVEYLRDHKFKQEFGFFPQDFVAHQGELVIDLLEFQAKFGPAVEALKALGFSSPLLELELR